MPNSVSPSLWGLVLHAGPMVKMVLLILLSLSLGSWTVIFAKMRHFRRASAGDDEFHEFFSGNPNLGEIYAQARRNRLSPMAGVFVQGYEELQRLRQAGIPSRQAFSRIWLECLERGLRRGVNQELGTLERALPFLATTGNAAPFIGLFGTVWGIMGSFHSIGLSGSASLASVAPGISEALIATAAGLAAAIPAVMAFNGFTSTLSGFEERLEGFVSEVLNRVEARLVQESGAARGKEG